MDSDKTRVPLLEPVAINSTEYCMPPRRTYVVSQTAPRQTGLSWGALPASDRPSSSLVQPYRVQTGVIHMYIGGRYSKLWKGRQSECFTSSPRPCPSTEKRSTEPRFVAPKNPSQSLHFQSPSAFQSTYHIFVMEPENLNPCNKGSTVRPRYPTNSEKSGLQLSAAADVIT